MTNIPAALTPPLAGDGAAGLDPRSVAPAPTIEPSRCDFHALMTGLVTTMDEARDEVSLFSHSGLGKFYAHALSMGCGLNWANQAIGPACCPAAAHARFLLASAFRTAGAR